MTIYEENGHANRREYLIALGAEHEVDMDIVFMLADLLGPNEDFDGLVSSLQDYSELGFTAIQL